jgi:hypothetical protein
VSVESFVFRDNRHAKDYPGLDTLQGPRDYIEADGRFEVATIPGRGFIAAHENSDLYLTGVGAEAIAGVNPRERLPTFARSLSPDYYNTLAEINPGVGAEPLTVDLELDPGRSLAGTVVDAEGNPVSGTLIRGLGARGFPVEGPRDSNTFEVTGLDLRRPRRLDVFHDGRELAGAMVLRGDESGPLHVRLQRWGVATGRIVDEDGEPHSGLELFTFLFGSDFVPDRGLLHKSYRVDQDGRFRFAVVPGLRYEVYAGARDRNGVTRGGTIFKDLTLAPGEVKDFGDLRVKRPSE